jgi:large subunit ribosomal protein L25
MKFTAFNRTTQGSGASRRLRNAGLTPAIVYGGTEAPALIQVDGNALFHALKKEQFHGSILEMELEGTTQQVLLRDFQMHAFKQVVLHADFQRVDANTRIHKKIPLHFVNAEVSPAVKLHGANVSHVLSSLDVSCLATQLPEFISVDLANIDVGHSVHVSDLQLPAGVQVITHGKNLTVATAAVPAGAVSAEATATEEAKPAAKGKKK